MLSSQLSRRTRAETLAHAKQVPPHKSSNSYKIRNVSVEMRDKCISLVGRDIPGDYLNLQMFFASLSDFFYEVSVNKHVYRIKP